MDGVGHRGMSSCYKLLAIWLRTNPSVSWMLTCVQSQCFECSMSIIKLCNAFQSVSRMFQSKLAVNLVFLRPPLKATWSMTMSAPGCRVEECVSLVQPTGFYDRPDPRRQPRLPTSCLYWGYLKCHLHPGAPEIT